MHCLGHFKALRSGFAAFGSGAAVLGMLAIQKAGTSPNAAARNMRAALQSVLVFVAGAALYIDVWCCTCCVFFLWIAM